MRLRLFSVFPGLMFISGITSVWGMDVSSPVEIDVNHTINASLKAPELTWVDSPGDTTNIAAGKLIGTLNIRNPDSVAYDMINISPTCSLEIDRSLFRFISDFWFDGVSGPDEKLLILNVLPKYNGIDQSDSYGAKINAGPGVDFIGAGQTISVTWEAKDTVTVLPGHYTMHLCVRAMIE